ncbi:conjugal transfer protein TraH [Neiella marina]|uniref:Conjugal transfer protein TraH n=1 Tax=Neiella holothuriorum TaxID=2870530 RepID=A0ABS7EGB7_9GAMM|nr:conjugal transfer protein TraH [Neiella holothuriorum]MBW8191394.1 conjugal transfer protein TraH [Neiella holothuriorum]
MISKRNRKLLLRTAIATSIWLATAPANAGNPMEDLFDDALISRSGSGAAHTSNRYGWAFGGASMRIRQVNPKLTTFRPASLRSGCNGVDFFAGSFSIINGDQLVQMGRGIMQGAATYAFGLALDSVCPSCKESMDEIQRKLEAFNKLASDSCKMSKAIAETAVSKSTQTEISRLTDSVAMPFETAAGLIPDAGDFFSDSDPTKGTNSGSSDAQKELVSYNVVWNAMKVAGMDSFSNAFSMSNTELMEFLMSLTGTTGMRVATDTDADKSNLVPFSAPSLLSVRDLVEPKTTGTIKVYDCQADASYAADATNCLNPVEVDKSSWNGLQQMYFDQLYGTSSAGTDGLGYLFHTKSSSVTDADREFLASSGMPLQLFFERLGGDMNMRRAIAEDASRHMAIAHVGGFIQSLELSLRAMEDAPIDGKSGLKLNELQSRVDKLLAQADTLRAEFDKQKSSISNISDGYMAMVDHLERIR